MHVNPNIRNFWIDLRKNDSKFHVFKKNRNLVYFGNDLSKNSYEFVANRMKNINLQFDHNHLTESFFKAIQLETGNEENLKNLAVKAVCEAFEIPEDLLDAGLNPQDIDVNNTEEKYPEEDYNYDDLSAEMKSLINKRILINTITQGASIHAFYTMHHLVKDELNEISDELIPLYDEISVGTVYSYWKVDYSKIVDKMDPSMFVQGSSKVEYKENDDNPKVNAKGRTFAVLCQELVKGAIECISLHALKDVSEEDLKIIYSFADKRRDEPKYIQIGSEVWRKFLSLLKTYREEEKISLPEFIMKIFSLDPENTENFFEYFISDEKEKAIALLG